MQSCLLEGTSMGIIAFNNEPKHPFTYLLNKEKNIGFSTEVKNTWQPNSAS
jgi:hypothetical protein